MKRQAGFTLIEVSIVLVIIGLLLGGVLKGQELIENAKIKRMNNDFSGIAAGAYSYLDRYAAIPGDDSEADRWTGTAVGDGDGIIEDAWNSATATDESNLFWVHLRRSNLITGGSSTQLPKHAFGGTIGVADSYLGLSGPVICMSNIAGNRAEIIDRQIDDGDVQTGILVATSSTLQHNSSGGSTPAAPDTTAYTASSTYSMCKQM